MLGLTEHQLQVLAYHIAHITTEPVGSKFGLSMFDRTYQIRIERGTIATFDNDVWNNVYIDNKHCGNRAGGRKEYIRLISAEAPIQGTNHAELVRT